MVKGSVLGVELSQLVGALESEAVLRYTAMHLTVKLLRESYTRTQVSLPECLQRNLHRPPKANCASNSTSDACEIPYVRNAQDLILPKTFLLLSFLVWMTMRSQTVPTTKPNSRPHSNLMKSHLPITFLFLLF